MIQHQPIVKRVNGTHEWAHRPYQLLITAACTNTGGKMKGSHPRAADRCPFAPRHSYLRLPLSCCWECYVRKSQDYVSLKEDDSTLYKNPHCVKYCGNDKLLHNMTSLSCLFNSLFKPTIKKTLKVSMIRPFVMEIHQSQVDSPHKWPVIWKVLPMSGGHASLLIFSDIYLHRNPGIADSLCNIQLIVDFCQASLPVCPLVLTINDLFYTHYFLKAPLVAFLSELFYWFEVDRASCVRDVTKPLVSVGEGEGDGGGEGDCDGEGDGGGDDGKLEQPVGACHMVGTARGFTILILSIKSLQYIWRSGTHRWNLRSSNFTVT